MNHTAALQTITDAHDDDAVASMIADAAVESERLPYCFTINHNVGAPKFEACPLPYDFKFGRTVGIRTDDKRLARTWIMQAAKLGYTVHRAGCRTPGIKDNEAYGFAYDIKQVRIRAARAQAPKPENDDEDIPF